MVGEVLLQRPDIAPVPIRLGGVRRESGQVPVFKKGLLLLLCQQGGSHHPKQESQKAEADKQL